MTNGFKGGEFDPFLARGGGVLSTVAKIATVVSRGFRGDVPNEIAYYNLDVIISVGYRVMSQRGTQKTAENESPITPLSPLR